MSYFDIEFPQQAFSAEQPPAGRASFRIKVRWRGQGTGIMEISTVGYSIKLRQPSGEFPVWSEEAQAMRPMRLTEGDDTQVQLQVPFGPDVIRFIEDRRRGGGPLHFEMTLNLYVRLITVIQGLAREVNAHDAEEKQVIVVGEARCEQRKGTCVVTRDEWLAALERAGWGMQQVFEVAVQPPAADERFKVALGLLRSAEAAFARGDNSTTVVEVRRAIEAAAAAGVPDEEDRKRRYERFWSEVFPGERDAPKRRLLDSIAQGLAGLRHKGAHGDDLAFQVEREDAEVALTAAVAVFRYLGEALARQAQQRG